MCVFLRSQLCVFPFLKFFNRKVKTLFCKKQIFLFKKMTHTLFFTNFLLNLKSATCNIFDI